MSILTSIQSNLTMFATTIAIIMLIVVGLIAMIKRDLRALMSGGGAIALGALVVAAAVALVSAIQTIGASIH